MTEEKKQSLQLISRLLCDIYNTLYDTKEVSFLLQDEHLDKIDSIVKTVEGTWFGFTHYPTEKDKAAAYFCFIIKDHPVIDGNKRLSVLWLDVYCTALNLKINIPKSLSLDQLDVTVENEKTMSMEELVGIVKLILFDL